MYKWIFLPDESIAVLSLPARGRRDPWSSELREVRWHNQTM